MPAAPAYLGCFKAAAGDGSSVLPNTLAEELTANNITEQCRQLAVASRNQAIPLFGISGSKCLGGSDLAGATEAGAAPETACTANEPNVSVMSADQTKQCDCASAGHGIVCCKSFRLYFLTWVCVLCLVRRWALLEKPQTEGVMLAFLNITFSICICRCCCRWSLCTSLYRLVVPSPEGVRLTVF
jgi:hypothetical protein